MPRNHHRPAARFGGPLLALSSALRRRDLPAAVGRSKSSQLLRRPATRAVALLTALCALLLAAGPASAEEVFTGQAAAARATDSTWIPAPTKRAAVCVVDTGVGNAAINNPDLANVIARFAVDGGSPDDLHHDHHGTRMAMIASAPYNNYGMVGIAPSINVVAVRASRDGATFGTADLTTAIQICSNKHITYNIKVVSLSLGGQINTGLDQASMAATQDAVDNARRIGLNVVAAAGNTPGPVDWPAGYGPVLAVGAADNAGARCSFAASGTGLDLWAPGCPLDVAVPDGRAAWAYGSSEATALVAGALAELRGLRSDLTPDQAEQLVVTNARATTVGPYLDVAAALGAGGLQGQLAAGHASIPATNTTPSSAGDTKSPPSTGGTDTTGGSSPATPDAGSPAADPGVTLQAAPPASAPRARLSKPSVRSARVRRGLLAIVFKGKPKGVEARVNVYARKKGRAVPTLARSLRVTGDRLRTRVSGTLSEVSITYRDPTGVRRTSAVLRVHPRT